MKVSQKGIKALMDMEAVELMPYLDQAQKLTVGIGHLLTEREIESGQINIDGNLIVWRNGLTREQSISLMQQDLKKAEDAVNRLVKVPLSQNQFDALTFWCYNVGTEAVKGSTLLQELNYGHYEAVPVELAKWNKVTKKVVQADGTVKKVRVVSNGLVKRRNKEIAIWKGETIDEKGRVRNLSGSYDDADGV